MAGQRRRPPAEQLGQLSFPPSQLPGARGITSHITTIPARPNPQAVMATELLPGEDTALLPGPDRIQTHQVTGYQMAAQTAFPAGG